ncbi:MAG TPA: hypothetical protein VGN42_19380, partial [Pirellulales bacterium]|nr:hypothetical protein [Pirellulales bacterium]
ESRFAFPSEPNVPPQKEPSSLATREACKELKRLLSETSHELAWRLQVGRLVERLVPADEPKRYGKKRMAALLEHLGKPLHFQSALYAARQAASCYSDSDLPALKGLGWCHLRWLTAVPDKKLRLALQKKCRKERWSCERLSREIQRELGTRGHGGRRVRPPKNFGAAVSLREMIRLAQRWSMCQPVWLDRHRKRLAGRFSASDLKGLEKDLEVACEKLLELKILVPESLAAVRAHLAELQAQNVEEKSVKRPTRRSNS